MKQLYALGEEVAVQFMGQIRQVEIRGDVVFYRVQGNTADCFWLTAAQITPVELPKTTTT